MSHFQLMCNKFDHHFFYLSIYLSLFFSRCTLFTLVWSVSISVLKSASTVCFFLFVCVITIISIKDISLKRPVWHYWKVKRIYIVQKNNNQAEFSCHTTRSLREELLLWKIRQEVVPTEQTTRPKWGGRSDWDVRFVVVFN